MIQTFKSLKYTCLTDIYYLMLNSSVAHAVLMQFSIVKVIVKFRNISLLLCSLIMNNIMEDC